MAVPSVDELFSVERSLPHGHVASVLGVGRCATDDLYRAQDWLHEARPAIERRPAHQHLVGTTLVLYGLTSTWLTGRCGFQDQIIQSPAPFAMAEGASASDGRAIEAGGSSAEPLSMTVIHRSTSTAEASSVAMFLSTGSN